jgi:CheY-like chemotaxis protein
MPKRYPVVIIDDDIDDQEMLVELTTSLRPEASIRSFNNGVEALEYLKTTPEQPFIILCDVNMPLMTGLELLESIQVTPFLKNKSIPFILLSTSGDKKYVDRAYELCVQGFFQKPPDLQQLKTILRVPFEFWDRCLHPHHPVIVNR